MTRSVERSSTKSTEQNPTVLETLQTYAAAKNPVNERIPQNFHGISTSGIPGAGRRAQLNPCHSGSTQNLSFRAVLPRGICFGGAQTRNGMAFRFESAHFGACRRGRLEIEKRPYVWRFLALKVPFGNVKFLNRCPVAGTIERGVYSRISAL